MANNFQETKRKLLEKRQAELIEELNAASDQLGRELSAANQKKIERQIATLETELLKIEAELESLITLREQEKVMPDKPANRIQTSGSREDLHALADVLRITLEHDGHPYKAGPGQWWVRLKVEGTQPIRNCQGYIYEIYKTEDERDSAGNSWPESQTTILSWADGMFAPITIEPYIPQYLDLAWRANGDPPIPSDELRVASSRDIGARDTRLHTWGMRQDFIPLKPGHYIFVVRFTSDDYAPSEFRYRIYWPGPYQEDSIRLTSLESHSDPIPKPKPTQPIEPLEMSWNPIGHWLWVRFLLWTAVSAVSFASDLAGVFDLSLCTRLSVITGLVFVGGIVILVFSVTPSQRTKHQTWDRGLTAFMLVVIVSILIWSATQNCASPSLSPEPTSTVTPSPSSTVTLVPTSTLTPSPLPSGTTTSLTMEDLVALIQPSEVGALIHFDDFESDTSNWRTWSDGDGRGWYENGGYNVRSYANTRGWMSIKLNDPYTHFILEVDVIPSTHELVTGYILAFAWTEGENYYTFEVRAGGECGFVKVAEKMRVSGFASNSFCPKPVQNETVRVRLEINQDKVTAFINGVFAGQKIWPDDEPYEGGNIGLGVYNSGELDSGAQAQVRFDNLAIWRVKSTSPSRDD